MPRRVRAPQLEERSNRLKKPIAKKPVFTRIGPGIGLGYRRNRTAGTWVVRVADGKGGNWTEAIGLADDYDDANGETVLDYWQAQDKARARAAEKRGGGPRTPTTVRKALEKYEADINARGGDTNNVSRLLAHLSDGLLDKSVAALTWSELRSWRDRLVRAPKRRGTTMAPDVAPKKKQSTPAEKLSPASINRTCSTLKAALNLTADDPDERIASRQAWERGLESIPDAERSRNVILLDNTGRDQIVTDLIAAAYRESTEFGLLVEVADATGARESQIARLNVEDLQAHGADPRLMMPSSKKGKKGHTKLSHIPVPIPHDLADRLRTLAAGRSPAAPLLTKPAGGRWKKSDHSRPFDRIVTRCGLADWEKRGYPDKITIYALRHTSIVRQIKALVPLGVIAKNHDTSVRMIEKHYSRYILDHTDGLTRAALPDRSKPTEENVVSFSAGAAA